MVARNREAPRHHPMTKGRFKTTISRRYSGRGRKVQAIDLRRERNRRLEDALTWFEALDRAIL